MYSWYWDKVGLIARAGDTAQGVLMFSQSWGHYPRPPHYFLAEVSSFQPNRYCYSSTEHGGAGESTCS
jgi:hypothetical protein